LFYHTLLLKQDQVAQKGQTNEVLTDEILSNFFQTSLSIEQKNGHSWLMLNSKASTKGYIKNYIKKRERIDKMADQKFHLEDVLDHLSRTPKVLRLMLERLPNDWIYSNEGENTWSPFDVVGHLIHGEKTDWITRTQIIIEHGDAKEFEPFDRQAQRKENKNKTFDMLLDEFEAIRLENIQRLTALVKTEQDLDQVGKHPELGTVTLRELLCTWAVHDFNHIGQIVRVMAKYYEDEVGPWKAYLGILQSK
jgi:uncharacterized damage-inducible protein DinB